MWKINRAAFTGIKLATWTEYILHAAHTHNGKKETPRTHLYIYIYRYIMKGDQRNKNSVTTRHALTLISRTSFHFSSRLGELDKTRSNTLQKHYLIQKLELRIWSPNKHFHRTKTVSALHEYECVCVCVCVCVPVSVCKPKYKFCTATDCIVMYLFV